MKILRSINILALMLVFLFAVACSGETKSTESETTTVEEPKVMEEAQTEAAPEMDSTSTEEPEMDSVMTEAVDSVSAEG